MKLFCVFTPDHSRFSRAIKSRRSEFTDSTGVDQGQPLVEPWRLITAGDLPWETLFRCLLAPSLGCFQTAFKGTVSLYPAFGEFRAICTVSGVELLFANKTMQLFQPSSCVNMLLPTLMSVGRFLLFLPFQFNGVTEELIRRTKRNLICLLSADKWSVHLLNENESYWFRIYVCIKPAKQVFLSHRNMEKYLNLSPCLPPA